MEAFAGDNHIDKWTVIRTLFVAVLFAYYFNQSADLTQTDVCYLIYSTNQIQYEHSNT